MSPLPEKIQQPELKIKPVIKSIWAYNKMKEQEIQNEERQKAKKTAASTPKPRVTRRVNQVVKPDFAIYNDDVTIIQLKEDKSLMQVELTPKQLEKKKRKEKRRERRRKRKKRSKQKGRDTKDRSSGVVSFCNPKSTRKMGKKERRIAELRKNSNEMPEDPMCALI